jgi:hypothetical protein
MICAWSVSVVRIGSMTSDFLFFVLQDDASVIKIKTNR